jgi:penicillin V acylase-like amidase (Ntn superfamily)
LDEYTEGSRHKKQLTYIKHYGNSNVRYVEFKDEKGNRLSWTTTDYTKAYRNLSKNGVISFTVKYVYQGTVNIGNLKIELNCGI